MSAFGRYQTNVRVRVRKLALECQGAGCVLSQVELMQCIYLTASKALTVNGVSMSFSRVGLWPLDVAAVSGNEKGKKADAYVTPYIELKKLTTRLIPEARKDVARPDVANGTLSTAGRATVLTADQVLAEFRTLDQSQEQKKKRLEEGKRVIEDQAAAKEITAAELSRVKSA